MSGGGGRSGDVYGKEEQGGTKKKEILIKNRNRYKAPRKKFTGEGGKGYRQNKEIPRRTGGTKETLVQSKNMFAPTSLVFSWLISDR